MRVTALLSAAALSSACGTSIRSERTVRADGRDSKTAEQVTPRRYSAERTAPKPFWAKMTENFRLDAREPAEARASAPAREEFEPGGDAGNFSGAPKPPAAYTNIVAVASVTASAPDPPRAPRPPSVPRPEVLASTAAVGNPWPAPAPADDFPGKPHVEVRYSAVRLWTDLETTFQSPSFTALNWNRRPRTAGAGPEVAYRFEREEEEGGVAARLGMFRGSEVTNSHREGGLYVIEKTRLESYWAAVDVRHSFVRWLAFETGVGVFYYRLRTELESNSTSFVYDSASVDGLFGAFAVGCALEAPWKFPLRPFAAARFWFPFRGEDTSFEWGVGQVSGGASWRFD